MRKNRIITYFFTAVLLIVAAFLWIVFTEENDSELFFVQINSNGKTEDIKYWKNEDAEYYVFLPSYVDLSKAQIRLNTENTLSIDGKKLEDGMRCDAFDLDVPYVFTYNAFGKSYSHNITFVKSDKVATMHIKTASGNMDYIHSKKGNEESATINVYKSGGETDFSGELKSIKGRGNDTWESYSKKPYNISFESESNLLGMGAAKEWILLANAGDFSNLRNKTIYDFADEFGLKYSPESQFVDLYLNDEYAGLYLLCERNEAYSERVDIEGEGSFLMSLEMEERLVSSKETFIQTEANQALRVHYPSNISDKSLNDLSDTWQSVENAILANDGIDHVTGRSWQELIDLDSWARKYLIEEVFGNCDACFISQYFYCDASDDSGKIYAGPVWDYDHSIGNSSVPELSDPQSFLAKRLYVKSGYESPWFYNLYNKKDFYDKVVELYRMEFSPLLEKTMLNILDKYATQISKSVAIDQIRWNKGEGNLSKEVEYIRSYMQERTSFFDEIWISNKDYHIITEDRSFGGFYTYHAVLDGKYLEELPTLEDTEDFNFIGWYYADTNEPFDSSKPIREDVEVYAKWQDKPVKTVKRIIKLVPVGVISVVFVILCIAEVKKYRKKRVVGNG